MLSMIATMGELEKKEDDECEAVIKVRGDWGEVEKYIDDLPSCVPPNQVDSVCVYCAGDYYKDKYDYCPDCGRKLEQD